MIGFTTSNGYLDGIIRGYRGALLAISHYANLSNCDTLDDLCIQLSTTDYGDVLQAGSKLDTTVLRRRLLAKMVSQFKYLTDNAPHGSKLWQALQLIQYGYMIDNTVLLLAGAGKYDSHHSPKEAEGKREEELLEQCHPLGMFDALPALTVGGVSQDEVHGAILQEAPIGKYFQGKNVGHHHELLRAQVWREYLEDFHEWVMNNLDSTSAEVLAGLLEREAERRTLAIAVNSAGSSLTRTDRFNLFPQIGLIHELGLGAKLAQTEDVQSIRAVIDSHPSLSSRFAAGLDTETPAISNGPMGSKLECCLAVEEAEDCKTAFEFPANYAVFYAWTRLKEQEMRNIVWVGECIAQKHKENVSNYIPIW